MPDYLYNVVNTQKNESWQKKQAIEAIKLLFKRIHAPLYQDIDFGFNQIIVRDTKGNKERVVPLPATLTQHFKNHLSEVKLQHVDDIDQGFGQVYMSQALVKKYGKSNHQWVWQYVFPSYKLSVDPRSGIVQRHHINESRIQSLLGHADVSTTMIYTHQANFSNGKTSSPLEDL